MAIVAISDSSMYHHQNDRQVLPIANRLSIGV